MVTSPYTSKLVKFLTAFRANFILENLYIIYIPLTSIITLLGFFSVLTIPSKDWAPMTLVPFASFAKKESTLSVVLLKAQTVKLWSFIFKMRF